MLRPLFRKYPLLISLIFFLFMHIKVNAYAIDPVAQYYYGLKSGESIALEDMLEQMRVCKAEDISCATLKGKGVQLSGDGNTGYTVTGVEQGCAVITVSLSDRQAVAVNVNSARDQASEAESGSDDTGVQKHNSSFTVLGKRAEDTYVAGLNEAALALSGSEAYTGKNVKLLLSMAEAHADEDIHTLNEEAGRNRKTVGMLFDLELSLQIEEGKLQELKTSPSMLVLHIPLEEQLQGRDRYVIYRMHNGEVQTLTEGTYGERIVPNSDRTELDIYLQKFSSYALTWEDIEPIELEDGTDLTFTLKFVVFSFTGLVLTLSYLLAKIIKKHR